MKLNVFIIVCAGIAVMCGSHRATAQDSATGPSDDRPLDLLEHALGSLDAPVPPGEPDASQQEVQAQLDDLREMVGDLQRVLDEKLVAIQELEDENEKLRQALRLRFGGRGGLPPVPIPERELLQSVLDESPPPPERKQTIGPTASREAFTIVSEWGRSPEVAASLPGGVSSLIGLTIAVDRGSSTDMLLELGRELRKNYAHYDNINIEVFDDVDAARQYANEGKLNPERRVLSVTRFKHSGRDSIVAYRDGQPVPTR